MRNHTSRRSFRPCIARVATLALFLACTSVYAAERPNIVLLMGDDHGWDETGYNGHPHVKTPVLDEMAAEGLRLDNFYSAHPVCSPTRASIITGRHPNRGGTLSANWSTRPEEISIAELLTEAGYACGHFGKWHLGPVKATSPLNPGSFGFEESLSHDNFFETDPYFSRNGGPPQKYPGESSEIVIEEAIRFIRDTRASQRPFFVIVWYGSPHEPYIGLDKDLALYDDLPAKYNERTVSLTDVHTGQSTRRPLGDVLRERYAEITAMDRSLGTLRDYLDDAGLRSNTLVWYCGDNGIPGSADHVATPFRGNKGAVYEGGLRVPGLIEWPDRVPEPRASDVRSVTTDMFPTICELVDLTLPNRPLDGISLVPILDGKMTERPTPICFWQANTGAEASRGFEPYIDPALQEGTTPLVKIMAGKFTRSFVNFRHPTITEGDFAGPRAIVDNRYKLVVDGSRGGEGPAVELFDLDSDPAEERNVADSHPEIAKRLSQQLRDWQKSVLESLTGADYR